MGLRLLRTLGGTTGFRKMSSQQVRLLGQQEAADIDQELFNEYGFSVDQLMELAGQACAHAVVQAYPEVDDKKKTLVICGPGNNGGDGLVCARHLSILKPSFKPLILYPKPSSKPLFQALVKQCSKMELPFIDQVPEPDIIKAEFQLVIDALFGFSFKGEPRPYAAEILAKVRDSGVPVASVDIPSGWDVEEGDVHEIGMMPDVLISLTAPKKCAAHFKGRKHFLGGRFVPEVMQKQRDLKLPVYSGLDQIVEITK